MARQNNNSKSLESWIWDVACSIRGAKDAPKRKDFILPLIFKKGPVTLNIFKYFRKCIRPLLPAYAVLTPE